MTKKLKFTSLLLIVTSLTFAQAVQQSIISTTRSNIKDRVALDTTKKPVKATEPGNAKADKIAIPPNSKTVITAEQAMTAQVNPPVNGIGVVVKNKLGSGSSLIIVTKDNGSFSTKLEEGNYTISINAEELKKTIANLKRKDEKINGATFVFDLPANFEFSGTESANKKGEFVAQKSEFEIKVPKGGITFSGKLLTTTTVGLSLTPTKNERGSGSPKSAGF